MVTQGLHALWHRSGALGSGEDQDSAIATTDDKISTTQRGIYVLKSSGSGNEVRIGHRSVFSRALSKIRRAADAFYIGKSGRSVGLCLMVTFTKF